MITLTVRNISNGKIQPRNYRGSIELKVIEHMLIVYYDHDGTSHGCDSFWLDEIVSITGSGHDKANTTEDTGNHS
jgi:hypothetical protein